MAARGQSTWTGAVAVVAVALLARTLEALLEPSVFNDGPRFIAMAASFLAGDWRAALSDSFHPLTSLVMAATSALLGLDLESSGELVSVVSGGLAALGIWLLARDQLGSRTALVAGILFALHPRLRASSSGVQSDGLHLLWFVLAALYAWRALDRGQVVWAALAGICTGLAYLTRPEGLAVGVVLAAGLALDVVTRRTGLFRTVALGVVYAGTLLAVSGPYLLAIHELSGRWELTQKKDLAVWTSAWTAPESIPTTVPASTPPDPSGPPPSPPAEAVVEPQPSPSLAPPDVDSAGPQTDLSEVLRDGLRGLHPVLLLLVGLGLSTTLRAGSLERRASAYGLGFLVLFVALLLLLHQAAGYVSRRHFLAAAALLMPLAGQGTLVLGQTTVGRLPRWRGVSAAPALGWTIALGILIEMSIPQSQPNKLARQHAARWLREHRAPETVATLRARDAYYAGATRHIELRDEEFAHVDEMLSSAHARGAHFAILDAEMLPGRELPDWAHVLYRAEFGDHEALVLELTR